MTSLDRKLREFRRFLTFAAVGVVGFVVDASVLYFAIWVGVGPRMGRVFSYLAAVTTTWALNRAYTFTTPSGRGLWSEWAHFSLSQLGGATANLGVYFVLIHSSAFVAAYPVVGVAIGSLSGLAINYLVARVFVFGHGNRYKRHSDSAAANDRQS